MRQVKTLSNKYILIGDIGQWLPNGSIKIIDRKKHIFKLSQGEYVVPEVIENILLRSQYVAQAFVHGDALKVIKGLTFMTSYKFDPLGNANEGFFWGIFQDLITKVLFGKSSELILGF